MTITPPSELLIATRNKGKLVEIQAALGDLPLGLRTLNEFSDLPSIEESGSSYRENAVIKAWGYARLTGLWALADDSGLEVDALKGAPGVHSARYGSQGATDGERIAFLLQTISQARDTNRAARFICVMVIAGPNHRPLHDAYGKCEGRIVDSPRGNNGFGYDPIFVPDGYKLTLAELPPEVKNAISHRARALKMIHDFLVNWIYAT
jgi:XTP/dITP diphosphohydrolase